MYAKTKELGPIVWSSGEWRSVGVREGVPPGSANERGLMCVGFPVGTVNPFGVQIPSSVRYPLMSVCDAELLFV